jgi:murein L,D-transpeptidase YcbB/YkuD
MKILQTLTLLILLFGTTSHTFANNAQNTEAVRQRIQQLSASQTQSGVAHNIKLSSTLTKFYAQRQFAPVWSDPKRLNQLLDALAGTAADGLNPEDYHLSTLKKLSAQSAESAQSAQSAQSANQIAELDVLATDGFLRALINLFRGKVDPANLFPNWNFEDHQIAPAQALSLITTAVDNDQITQLFAKSRPQHPLYPRFQNALAELRTIAAKGGWPQLPPGPTLKPGMRDPRVVVLRQRLAVAGDLPSATNGNDFYDKNLSEAVAAFQREQYLGEDGAVGPATLAALNVSIQARIDQMRVNLERARWLLHDIPENFVLVDVAGYKITYYKNSKPIWRSRVQVGKPFRSTPIFKSAINYITLNPTWTVPPTILRNDILPKVRKNPNYLAAHNIRALNSRGEIIDAAKVDWRNPGNVTLRQDASPEGSLGLAVIRFPNTFSVYLHDTPHKELFAKNQRDFSSGCIRVQNVLELVALLLADTPSWDQAAINKVLAEGKTRNVSLAKTVPVLLAYWTVDIDESGHIAFKPDIYNRDRELLTALNKPVIVSDNN